MNEELIKQIEEKREAGMTAEEACRAVGVKPPTYYGWKGSRTRRNRKVSHATIMVEETPKQSKEKVERAKLLIGLALEELNRL